MALGLGADAVAPYMLLEVAVDPGRQLILTDRAKRLTQTVGALRTGRHMGQSRPIQPPMPWQACSQMTDAELRSIYAYLRTVPPVSNLVPDYRAPGSIDELPAD